MINDPEELTLMSLNFPKGTRLILLSPEGGEDNELAPPAGTRGVSLGVDEYGLLHVKWDTGVKYNLSVGKDRFDVHPFSIIFENRMKTWINVEDAIKYYTNIYENKAENSSKQRINELKGIISGLKGDFSLFSQKKVR